MKGYIAWRLDLKIRDGHADAFRALMDEMVTATKANEPGTLAYEWNVTPDGTVCHLYERYADLAAAMVHIGTFGAKYAERFLAVLEPTGFTVYGSPNAKLKAALADFGPAYLEPAAGFSR
jgi:quinol monooxygenase YgiN